MAGARGTRSGGSQDRCRAGRKHRMASGRAAHQAGPVASGGLPAPPRGLGQVEPRRPALRDRGRELPRGRLPGRVDSRFGRGALRAPTGSRVPWAPSRQSTDGGVLFRAPPRVRDPLGEPPASACVEHGVLAGPRLPLGLPRQRSRPETGDARTGLPSESDFSLRWLIGTSNRTRRWHRARARPGPLPPPYSPGDSLRGQYGQTTPPSDPRGRALAVRTRLRGAIGGARLRTRASGLRPSPGPPALERAFDITLSERLARELERSAPPDALRPE